MIKTLLAAVCGCLLWPGAVLGQVLFVTGTVTNEAGTPLIGANVVVDALLFGGSTDLEGRYSFEVPTRYVGKTVRLTASYFGHVPQTLERVLPDDDFEQDFSLPATGTALSEADVSGLLNEVAQSSNEPSYVYEVETQPDGATLYLFTGETKPQLTLVEEDNSIHALVDLAQVNEVLVYLGLPEVVTMVPELRSVTLDAQHQWQYQWEDYPLGQLTIAAVTCAPKRAHQGEAAVLTVREESAECLATIRIE